MRLQVSHLTKYVYREPVIDSVNEVRLTPKTEDCQTCCDHSIAIRPSVSLFPYTDYFGNTVHYFSVPFPHEELVIESRSIVQTSEASIEQTSCVPYGVECEILESESFQNQYAEYLMETAYTKATKELEEFARGIVHDGEAESVYELLGRISHAIYTTFTYDTNVTNVHTTVEETLQLKRGVCQDYAHLMIAVCRLFHIPCRYVSGYHYIGELGSKETNVQHFSHAWVEAYVPLIGWRGLDPTNNEKTNWRYIKIGHGRNYSDVVPVKGMYRGTSCQQLEVTVELKRVQEEHSDGLEEK